jgi:hypothetical protein
MKAVEYKDGKTIYRDMTPEEIAELEAMQANTPTPPPTPEQRLDVLEGTTDDIILMMADLIGGGE